MLRLLQAGREGRAHPEEVAALVADTGEGPLFAPEESTMIERVLAMGERDVRSIMVPRADMVWLDVRDPRHVVLEKFALGHARLPLCAATRAMCWAWCICATCCRGCPRRGRSTWSTRRGGR
ncbi:membrane protein [Bordetella pertussis]|nr:membrane protein [Bordetella pertussis]